MAVCAAIAPASEVPIRVFHCTTPATKHTTQLWSRTLHTDIARTSFHRWDARSIVVVLITLSVSVSFHFVLTIISVRRSMASSSSGWPLFLRLAVAMRRDCSASVSRLVRRVALLSTSLACPLSFSVRAFSMPCGVLGLLLCPYFLPRPIIALVQHVLHSVDVSINLYVLLVRSGYGRFFSTLFTNPFKFILMVSCDNSSHARSLR